MRRREKACVRRREKHLPRVQQLVKQRARVEAQRRRLLVPHVDGVRAAEDPLPSARLKVGGRFEEGWWKVRGSFEEGSRKVRGRFGVRTAEDPLPRARLALI